jgi:hypothetical protein
MAVAVENGAVKQQRVALLDPFKLSQRAASA